MAVGNIDEVLKGCFECLVGNATRVIKPVLEDPLYGRYYGQDAAQTLLRKCMSACPSDIVKPFVSVISDISAKTFETYISLQGNFDKFSHRVVEAFTPIAKDIQDAENVKKIATILTVAGLGFILYAAYTVCCNDRANKAD